MLLFHLAGSLLFTFAFGSAISAADSLSYQYQAGTKGREFGVRTHAAEIPPRSGRLYVYCTFDMGPVNPILYKDGVPEFLLKGNKLAKGTVTSNKAFEEEWTLAQKKAGKNKLQPPRFHQVVMLGRKTGGKFEPVIKFGLVNDGRFPAPNAYISPWINAGGFDYYSLYCRPNTSYDYKIELDLKAKQMTVWVSGRGDGKWYLITEDAPLAGKAVEINHVRVEQQLGAAGIRNLTVRKSPDAAAEKVRPHPAAKTDRTVATARGYRFQSMRSVWGKPGRHVTIRRNPGRWYGFPDVVQVNRNTLACAYSDGGGHGGYGSLFVQLSHDLGRTWEKPKELYGGGGHCPRIQKLKDQSLLFTSSIYLARNNAEFYDVVQLDSRDEGKTWINERWNRAARPRHLGNMIPSRIVEMPDGSWRMATVWMETVKGVIKQPNQIRIWKSADRGKTWELLTNINAWPPHHVDEPSLILLPDGRLMMVTREWRDDQLPALKGYSTDGGKTWKLQELPFHVQGRTCGALLKDGRVMVTFRSGCGRSAEWAWIGDPDETPPYRACGAHINDRHSVGLKNGALHIDSDGVRGQFTRYYLRPADTPNSKIDFTVEAKIVSNAGRAATISIPFVGKFRLFPNRIQLAGHKQVKASTEPGKFHTYRFLRVPGKVTVFVDGKQVLETGQVDEWVGGATMQNSRYLMAFGNEGTADPVEVFPDLITTEVTGYSIWRRFHQVLDDPKTGRREISWSAESGEFPDQYQLDHIVEIDACAVSWDQGYPGWTELPDGRIFTVNYTDDTAPPNGPGKGRFGVSWIRGTYVLPSDLPPLKRAKR